MIITLDTGLVYSVSSTYFRLQTNILTGAIDENYYIYYGNSKETEFPPKNLDKILWRKYQILPEGQVHASRTI